MAKVCENFASMPEVPGKGSLRLVIPKAVSLIYTLRNKRGIGHVGGDVDANAIDGAAPFCVLSFNQLRACPVKTSGLAWFGEGVVGPHQRYEIPNSPPGPLILFWCEQPDHMYQREAGETAPLDRACSLQP